MVLYSANNEEIYGIVPYQNFHVMFNIWVICGSHPDCFVGQWVKWVNRCDPFSTL